MRLLRTIADRLFARAERTYNGAVRPFYAWLCQFFTRKDKR